MKRIAILGCENSHAATFLDFIFNTDKYKDVEVVGVYSNEPQASAALNEKFGVPILDSYKDAVGMIDGLIITARHGDLHYEYAKPYIDSGVPMFIDKPVTIKEDEALKFMRELKVRGVRVCGGSSLKHDAGVGTLKAERENDVDGATFGGYVRAPLDTSSVYGGLYFYAPHLVEIVCEIFGRYPISVEAKVKGDITSVRFNYEKYFVDGLFIEHNYVYYACRFADKSVKGMNLESTEEHNWFKCEFDEFYSLLHGESSPVTYKDFISSVFIMNAIERSIASGKEETVTTYEI